MWHIGKFDGVVGVRPHRLAQILAYLAFYHVKRGRKFDVADMIATQIDVHEARYFIVIVGVAIVMNTLDKGVGAVTHADNGNSNLFVFLCHFSFPFFDFVFGRRISQPCPCSIVKRTIAQFG